MRALIITISFLCFSASARTQTKWQLYNDSLFQQTKDYYSTCNSLTSSKAVNIDQFKNDQMLMQLTNLMYNKDSFRLQELKTNTKHLKNRTIHQTEKNGVITIEFNAHARGNLYLSLKAVLIDQILNSKEIHLSTKTHVLCDGNEMYVNALDFLYLRRLLEMADFPMKLKPYQSSLIITKTD